MEGKAALWKGGFKFYFLAIRTTASQASIIWSLSSWEQPGGGGCARRVCPFGRAVEGQGKPRRES